MAAKIWNGILDTCFRFVFEIHLPEVGALRFDRQKDFQDEKFGSAEGLGAFGDLGNYKDFKSFATGTTICNSSCDVHMLNDGKDGRRIWHSKLSHKWRDHQEEEEGDDSEEW